MTIELYTERYDLTWMDRDPVHALANHGQPGRVVNAQNPLQLRSIYELEVETFGRLAAAGRRSDSRTGLESAKDLALELIHQFKL